MKMIRKEKKSLPVQKEVKEAGQFNEQNEN